MNPFELTKDPDGGGITVRIEHGFVVLTREDERRVTERITEILAENAKLREALCASWKCAHAGISCSDCRLIAGGCTLQTAMQELGIEVPK